MTINISFGGATIKRPGAFSIVDTSGMTVVAAGGFKVLAAIGVPGTGSTITAGKVTPFNDPTLAGKAIVDSELLDIMKIAWAHGADLILVSPVAATATDTDWQAAIDLLGNEAVDGIMLATTTDALEAKVSAHCTLMSSVGNRRERRAFYGHATGLAAAGIVALQSALNTERGIMASPGVYYFDSNGDKVLKGSHYLAAAYAGIWAGQPSQEPITYKYVQFPGLEKIYDITEINTLLDGHIAPVEYVKNYGYRIVQGVTLKTTDNLTEQELSVSTIKDDINEDTRNFFESKYVGHAGEEGIEVTIYNDLVSRIEREYKGKRKIISGYVPESVKVIKDGTSFITEWEGKPVLPINNFLSTTHFTL